MAGNGGGNAMGPRVLQVLDFAGARAPELQALRDLAHDARAVSAADEKLLTQKNQRRRRANAFNSYRMPQRLKQRGSRRRGGRQQKSEATGDAAEKRCRTHERRPHKLLAQRTWETAPEAGKAVLLPTHVWHAKRMKMQSKHGVVVAERRTDKSVSAALEGLRKTAVMHDASYFGVLELFGLPQVLLEALQLVSDPAGSDFHGMRFLSGGEEGRSMLYHAGQFPNGAICPVTFMWRPLEKDWSDTSGGGAKFELHEAWETTKRQLWLWIHPAAFMEAATAIAAACREVVDEGEEIEIYDRRGHLCRFKVRGKRADELVASLCEEKCAVVKSSADVENGSQQEQDADDVESDHEDGFESSRTAERCAGANRLSLLKAVRRSTKGLDAAQDNSAAVFSVAVADPRCYSTERPLKPLDLEDATFSLLKEPPPSAVGQGGVDEIVSPLTGISLSSFGKCAEEPDSAFIMRELSNVLAWTTNGQADGSSGYPYAAPSLPADIRKPKDVSMASANTKNGNTEEDGKTSLTAKPCSWLWSLSKRDFLRRGFHKDHEINTATFRKRKSAIGLLSGSAKPEAADRPEDVSPANSLLHLLVVRQTEPFPDVSGWDLVCSPSMALVLLKALVFRGGMVVGTEEDTAIATVLHVPSFPRDFPDTKAGQEFWREAAQRLKEEHERKPKAKRFAYEKHGVLSPFKPKWRALFPDDDAVMTEADEGEQETEPDSLCVLRGATYMEPFCFYPKTAAEEGPSFIPVAVPTLVRVVVSVIGRGNLCPNTMLYSPSEEDRAEFERDNKWRGSPVDRTEQRALVGYVTSAVYDRPKATFRAIGFCSCESLQRLFLACKQQSSSRAVFALARPPQGKMLRPVRLDVSV